MASKKTQKNSSGPNTLPFLTALLFGIAGLLIIFIFVSLGTEGDDTTPTVNVGNDAPSVSSVLIATSSYGSQANSINLTEATTTALYIHGTITDNNGCEDVATSGSAKIYFNNTSITVEPDCLADELGSLDDINCYVADNDSGACSFGSIDSGSQQQCNGGDTSVSFECQFDIQHFADATGSGGTFVASDWRASLVATDESSSKATSTVTTTMEVLTAINVGSSINYGTIALNATSSDIGLQVTNTGNEEVDVQLSGTNMPCTSIGTIDKGQQKYATGSVGYAVKTALTASATLFQLDLGRQTVSTTISTSSVNWQIQLPSSGVAGTCTGTTTLTAIQST